MEYIFLAVLGYCILKLRKRENLICLMYHNVFTEIAPGIIGKDEFEAHMEYIRDMRTFKMEELESLNYKLPENSILVTFDDGYKNNYTNAFPILKKYNIKATIFLNTKYIGEDESYLNWNEIREMYGSGLVDFQMHTHSHSPTIKKPEIKGFFEKNEGEFVKREYYTVFNTGTGKDFRNFDFTGLPVFKIRSQIAIRGYRLKDNFLSEYRKIEEREVFQNESLKGRKKYLNRLFRKEKDKYFEEVTEEEFKEKVKFEIAENKKIIEEKLDKKAEYLAYPWGHAYSGKMRDIEELGVKGFVFTTGGINNRNLNYKRILRINGDAIKNYDKFIQKLKRFIDRKAENEKI